MAEEKKSPTGPSPAESEVEAGFTAREQSGLSRLFVRRNDLNELGKEMLQQSLQYDEAQLERDAIRVKRKLDFLVLPMMMTTYMLSFLDKQTLNYSNAYGLQADTHMKGDDYSWVASALYFGWLCGAWPWNLALQRFPIAKLIGGMLFVWGAICMLQATVFNFSGFFAVRFFLGMMEACISPAWVLLTSLLWTRQEQTLRSSFWLSVNGVSSILGALLAYGSGHAEGLAVSNWKLIYLIVGALTFAWGFVIILWLPDGPHNAKMLTEYERVVAVWRVSKNQIGLKHAEIKPAQIKEALLDGKCYLIYLTGIAFGILNGGVANFLSAIIKGFGFDALKTSLLQTPGGAFEVVGCIVLGYLSQMPNMVGVTIIIGCLPGMAGLIGILTISIKHRYALVGMCWMQNVLGSPIVLNWTVPAMNVAGHTKRATVLGIYFVLYCAGNIAGPHLFLADEVPRYPTAIKGLLGTYCAAILFQGLYTLWCWIENTRRDKAGLHLATEQELLEGFEDKTDKENVHFRYTI
ncbi:MFS general substrate transporter [Pleurostoma richardsiae]|uniref:MFS general substrate transporter n=1 Tax=Pleurostoma richardsiae TaxID=41990 RepID=A0AA38RIZ5_9PEZI|nr:MFS general substrate transporter [Pleurostoma richardsiae]